MSSRVRVALAVVALPAAAWAQERERCVTTPTPETRLTRVQTPGGQFNIYMGAGVRISCPTKDLRLSADSLESYGDEGRIYLVGNVTYTEPRLDLASDFLTYQQRDEHIVATGDVDARLPSGSTLKGPFAEYFRAIPGRPVPRLHARGRPTITLAQRDSAGRPAPPTVVNANAVTMIGDSLVYAGGQVVVTREDVVARGDSMDLDAEREITVLMRGPSIEGRRGERPFKLSGRRIELTGADRTLRRVLSKGAAAAVSEDMTLASDTIDLRVENDLLQRAIAWGPGRARAFSATQNITADSIDVVMPAQRIREMHAVRGAIAQGQPDTTRFKADTLDWMRGDTIVARFDSAAAGDTSRAARIRVLVAQGSARSYHHLAPSDSTVRRPAINYVTGREIVVDFENQRVAKVTVIEQAAGVYLEPTPVTAAPDSARPPTRPGTTQPTVTPTTRPPTTSPTAGRPAPPPRRPR